MNEVDLVVVGAGPAGLIAAHTWLKVNPSSTVIVFESDPGLGGVWSQNRAYPTLMTQSPVGMLEYSIFPMEPPKDTYYDYFSGSYVFEYLDAFSQSTKFAGKTVKDRIQFNSHVDQIRRKKDGWMVHTVNGNEVVCRKLMLAVGPTSTPRMPEFFKEDCGIPIIHHKYLNKKLEDLTAPEVEHILVVGGAKSAFDAVYLLIKQGKAVTWLIRTAGQGPALVAAPDGNHVFRNSHEIMSVRLVMRMSPSIFDPVDGWLRFFHQSWIGRWIADGVFSMVNFMWTSAAKYGRNANFSKLKPDRPAFWSNENIGIQNQSDMWDVVSKATILRDEIDRIEGHVAILKSGDQRPCDAVVTCTGWDVTYPAFTTEDSNKLGLPLPLTTLSERHPGKWEKLIAEADLQVVQRFPKLSKSPNFPDRKPTISPNYLYRAIVPIEDPDQSVAFIGQVGTTDSFLVAEIQSLWAVDYLTKRLSLPPVKDRREEVSLRIAWHRRRYLSDGNQMLFDQLPYQAVLLEDMGLNQYRKGGGWRELLEPYYPKDFRGISEEWMELRSSNAGRTKI